MKKMDRETAMVHGVMVELGYILPDWRIKIEDIRSVDFHHVIYEVTVWESRKRKPTYYFNMFADYMKHVFYPKYTEMNRI